MHYVTFWKNLKVVAGLDKLASSDDNLVAQQAQPLLASACDEAYREMKKAAAEILKDASPVQLTQLLFSMRDSHRVTGEKFAAAPEEAAELFQKLVTAAYVDDMLDTQLEKLAGDEYEAARRVQLLGREYAVNLMRGLFA